MWFIDNINAFNESNNDYSEEYILWDINTEENKLHIINYFSDEFVVIPKGEYDFIFTNNKVIIKSGDFATSYDYEFDNDKLILSDNPEADGPLICFSSKIIDCIDDPFKDLLWLSDIKLGFDSNQYIGGHQIIQYIYNEECVYLVDACFSCPEKLIEVYNVQGEIICEFGGINGSNTCPDFFNTATNKRYLYNKGID